MVCILMASQFYKAGKDVAERQEEFQVIPKSVGSKRPEVVVLRIYGDYLITAPLIRSSEKNEVKKELYIFKISDEMSNTSLAREKIGPLKIK